MRGFDSCYPCILVRFKSQKDYFKNLLPKSNNVGSKLNNTLPVQYGIGKNKRNKFAKKLSKLTDRFKPNRQFTKSKLYNWPRRYKRLGSTKNFRPIKFTKLRSTLSSIKRSTF